MSTPVVKRSKATHEIQGGVIDKREEILYEPDGGDEYDEVIDRKVEEDEIICEPDGKDEYNEEECYKGGDGVDFSLSVPVPNVLLSVFTFDATKTFRYPYVHLLVIHLLYYDTLMGIASIEKLL